MNNESKSYDTCYDCGSDMTAALDAQNASLTIKNLSGDIQEVYVSCNNTECGGRAGHRDYNPENH